jgi:hypothetical protein
VTPTDSIRASRDGDQFHYYWAARQCLKLLRPGSGLVGVSIEGSSPLDTATAGEEVVDIAEYYGDIDPESAEKIFYRQLKHSTANADEAWTASGLRRTLEGFGQKFRELRQAYPARLDRVAFSFVSNRPVSDAVVQALDDIARGADPSDPEIVGYIRRYLALPEDLATQFCQQFAINLRAPALLRLTHLFRQDVAALLPGAPNDGPLRLKEAVARRATSLEPNLLITAEVVLAALGASSDQLLPAPSLLQVPDTIVPIPQAGTIALALAGSNAPLVVHAAGGVGKSVLASQFGALLPGGSVCLVYDCFALGGYRRSSSPRHEHRQGYVQLANQLASTGLCDPLVPGNSVSASDYSRAFMARVGAVAESLEASSPGALLVLVIDAADNAVLAAREQDTGRSFVVDLLREDLPANARVVEFCRTERMQLLETPPGTRKFEVAGFGLEQTRQHLESRFGPVTSGDASEFHRRTGGNARVQNQVMRETETLEGCLSRLSQVSGNDVTTVDDLLADLLEEVKYNNGPEDAAGIDSMCEALAALRPRIPIGVLVSLCGISPSLVRSFAADLHGALLADGDTLQFRDEPTETWFRMRFRPQGDALKNTIERLRPLASSSAYVAASLPYLMWESGDFEQLVSLAMADDALPVGNDLERHQIAQQRVQFALKAALRQRAYRPAGRLALRAGAKTSGHSRRLRLLRENSDLAGEFLDPQTIEDLVAARDLIGEWPNSNLVHEGALLSFAQSQQDYARSRLRSAIDWTVAWVRAPRAEHEQHSVSLSDIAEMAFGLLNVDGAAACVGFLQRWSPPAVPLKPAAIIASRLAQHGRLTDIENLLRQDDVGEYLLVGVASAAAHAGLTLDSSALERCVAMLQGRAEAIATPSLYPRQRDDPDVTLAVCWIVALGVRYQLLDVPEAQRILALYLPTELPRSAGSRWGSDDSRSVIKGLALLSRLRGGPLDVRSFASPEIAEAMERSHIESSDAAEFRANVEPFAAWADLWVRMMLGEAADFDDEFRRLASESLREVSDYRTPYMFLNAVARTASLLLASRSSDASRTQFAEWVRSASRYVFLGALTEIVQHAAGSSPELHDLALEIAELIAAKISASHDGAETQIEDLVALARAIYRLSPDESRAYFQQAVNAAEHLGDDIHARWSALLIISGVASAPDRPDRNRAYRLGQITESLGPYLNDGLDYEAALHAITQLARNEGIAIASRWRDRRVGWLDPTIQALALRDDCAMASMPLACVAMTMFQRRPTPLAAADRAIRSSPSHPQIVADAIAALPRYMVGTQTALKALLTAAEESGATFDSSRLDRYEAPRHSGDPDYGRSWSDGNAEPSDLAAARTEALRRLGELDLSTPAGLAAGRRLCEDTPLHRRDVINAALAYPPARLAQVIRTLTADVEFSGFDYNDAIRDLAGRTTLPQSARSAARDMAGILAIRFCVDLTTKSYDVIDLDALRAVGALGTDPIEIALEELGRRPDTLAGEACFILASRIVRRLSPEDACQLFDDASDQYQDVAPIDAADGPFSSVKPPPSLAEACIAGFIWTALGDASIATRWQAAHAVCVLVSLRQSAVLEALAQYATGELPVGPFVDQRLYFYDKHATVWLLTALERSAAAPDRSGVMPFIPFLLATAWDDKDHVVIRDSVRNILLLLRASGLATLDAETEAAVESANRPVALRRRQHRQRPETDLATGEHDFRFFFDFGDYWCRPLAEVFDLEQGDVLRLASAVVTEDWALPYRGEVSEDGRRNRGLYAEDSNWTHSEWPQEDDLDFYLGFHALMTVAGSLIRDRPVYSYEDEEDDQFRIWLQRFRPSRSDGRWLADRRDGSPHPVLAMPPNTGRDSHWELSLSASSFDACASAENGWLTVWEDSTERTHDRSQDIAIQSALVDPVHSRALAAALQTAPSYHDFRLPSSDDGDYTFNSSGYQLSGWISLPQTDNGLDSRDPFAARISFPPPQPSHEIANLLDLRPDADLRVWRHGSELVMRSTVWDDMIDSGQSTHGPDGKRLEIRRDFLDQLLHLTGARLIMTVMIHRSRDHRWRPQDRDTDERFPYPEKSYRVSLLGDDQAAAI